MGNAVLFATGLGKDVSRAENINAVYDAYNGRKKLMSTHDFCFDREARSGEYSLLVIDIFPTHHYMKTIMIWHAIQGGKYIGLDERRTYYKRAYADNIDCIVAAGYGGIEMFNRCTGVPKERIIDLGMPRTDRYKRKKKGSGGTALADKRSYLYVPTFRNLAETPLPCIDWQYIDNQLTDDELFVIKSHPYGCAVNAGQYKHIIEVPQMEPSVNYLYDCDVVVTDYSSIMFDGYLLKKPCVLFEKNPGYTSTRGMYLKYPEQYSSRYATNEKELLELCRSAKWLRTAEKKCLEYVADACDGHSCERICELIDEMKG